MLPSATPLAQCFIELLREMAANRGFFKDKCRDNLAVS